MRKRVEQTFIFQANSLPRDYYSYEFRCSECGGALGNVACTEEERMEYGCGREWDCCSAAFTCESCGHHFAIGVDAPEME